jgi:hypothetical protein
MTTKKNTKTQATIAALANEAERCLDELRTLPQTRKYAARRAMTQRRYADIGAEMRRAIENQR